MTLEDDGKDDELSDKSVNDVGDDTKELLARLTASGDPSATDAQSIMLSRILRRRFFLLSFYYLSTFSTYSVDK